MTVSSTTSRVNYTGNGSNTTFAFTFKIFNASDLFVWVGGILKTLNTDYTVPGTFPATGGNVVFVTAPGSGVSIVILRILPLTQSTDYVEGDPFPAETHEDALDRLVMIGQQVLEIYNRCLRLPPYSIGSGELPTDFIANYFMKVNSLGTGFELHAGLPYTSPAGANKEIQINDNGILGADADLTWDKANKILYAKDFMVKGPCVDVRAFMDGQSGRPTYATWYANQVTTDVTSVIEAARDFGAKDLLLVGTFRITHGLVFSLGGVVLHGLNWNSSKIFADYTGDVPAIQFKGVAGARLDYNGIKNLYIYTNSEITGTPAGNAVEFDYCVGPLLENVFIDHFGKTALNFLTVWEPTGNNIRITNCGKLGSSSTGVWNFHTSPIVAGGCTQTNFSNIIMGGNYGTEIKSINTNGNAAININNLIIENAPLNNAATDDLSMIRLSNNTGFQVNNFSISFNTKPTGVSAATVITTETLNNLGVNFSNGVIIVNGNNFAPLAQVINHNTNLGDLRFNNVFFNDYYDKIPNNKFVVFTAGGYGKVILNNCGFLSSKTFAQLFGSPSFNITGDIRLETAGTPYSYIINSPEYLADSATPSVTVGDIFLTGGTTTITNFTGGYTGKIIKIISEHAITITDGTNIFLNGSANFVMAVTDTLTLIQKSDGKWYEIGRSDNT